MDVVSPLWRVYQTGILCNNRVVVKENHIDMKFIIENIISMCPELKGKLRERLRVAICVDRGIEVQVGCLTFAYQGSLTPKPLLDHILDELSDIQEFLYTPLRVCQEWGSHIEIVTETPGNVLIASERWVGQDDFECRN
ncbi:MAG: hypothetical protein NZ992_06245 [Candidatus Korarchaeum sp.]|nr:hypothetical protein [Candidatus Korarchaeum sp.]